MFSNFIPLHFSYSYYTVHVDSLIVCTTVLIEKSPQALPLGAACIASAIIHDVHTSTTCAVVLVAVSAEDDDYVHAVQTNKISSFLADKLLEKGIPAVICFSVYVWNRTVLEAAAAEVKNRYREIICIAGGPEVTADPCSFTSFDYTVAGEGERAVPELIARLLAGEQVPLHAVAGVYPAGIKQPAGIARVRAVPLPPEQLSSPYLDGTLDPAEYGGVLWELARGCPFKCSYCYESKGEKTVRLFPMERIEKELTLFAQKKVTQVFVLDPTYNADKKRALDMIRLIARKAPDMFCCFEARAELIDRELARAFTTIPCSLQIGLQSSDEQVLALVHRQLDKKLFVRNISYLNNAGVVFGFDLIYGLPGDSLSGFCASIDFAAELYPNNLELFCLSVLPGTDLYERVDELHITGEHKPPYHVLYTDRFSPSDIEQAAELSRACSIFYNQGRAVPWFLTICRPLRIKPSAFFTLFAQYLIIPGKNNGKFDCACMDHRSIEKIQTAFVNKLFTEKNRSYQVNAVDDVIMLNGALSRSLDTGTQEKIRLHYYADDILSPAASDLDYFVKNVHPRPCTAETFRTKDGSDWRVVN
jgi:radical SAM superfamily enzyme YgiQ (UPF0313 family)